jgi:antitoxin component YwqK of YwqJK toxin-antitoxin module
MASVMLYAQAYSGEVNHVDESGKRQGYWIITGYMTKDAAYSPEAKVEEGEYRNSQKEGLWKRYWPNGKLKSEITYEGGHPQGWYRTYYDTGVCEEEGGWWNNRNAGYLRRWHPNGQAQQMFNFDNNGKRQGLQRYFYENGNLELEVSVINGSESGPYRRYYPDGSLAEEKVFENGAVVPGSLKTYKPKSEFKEAPVEKDPYDKKVGTEIAETPTTSVPNKAETFKPNGFNTLYNSAGQLSEVGEFKKGKMLHGKVYRYNSSGLLIRIEIYKNGKCIGNGVIDEEK